MCSSDDEILLPPLMLGTNTGPGPLGLAAQCFKSLADLKRHCQMNGYELKIDYDKYQPVGQRTHKLKARVSRTRRGAAPVCNMQ
jgi:hypothetical protein